MNAVQDMNVDLIITTGLYKKAQHSLCICLTSNGCGWSVKHPVKMKGMCVVMEYVGKVIRSEEAKRQG